MKKLIILSLSFLCCNLAFAKEDNNCGKLSITITNTTNNVCSLIDSKLVHGYFAYTSNAPAFIPAQSTSAPVFLKQSAYGPELELSYDCGNDKKITFTSKQNLCFASAGEISGNILQSEHMDAQYTVKLGSWFWSEHGAISWRLI